MADDQLPLSEGARVARSPLFEAAKELVRDWEDRVSLSYEGGWPAMESLAQLVAEVEEALAVLDQIRQRWEETSSGSG
jgi:hypothetical protein